MKNKKVLFISFIDLENNPTSASGVRPRRLFKAFESVSGEVRMVTGIDNSRSARQAACRQVREWLKDWEPDLCYVELPSGPLFFHCDRALLVYLKKTGIPMGIFYPDIYWHFPKDFAAKGSLVTRLKLKLVRLMQLRDIRIFANVSSIMYYPSMEMSEILEENYGCKNSREFTAGCYVPDEIKTEANDICTALYVGGATERYGLPLLIRAVDIVNKERIKMNLEVVCQKNGWLTMIQEYPELAESRPWLRLNHLSAGPELEALHRKCDFAINPILQIKYNHFAFPVKMAEYLSFLLPVVTTNCRVSSEFVSRYDIGIVAEDNPEAFAEALTQMAENEQLRVKFRRNAVVARTENLWEVKAAQVIKDLT